jgi:hypothetical protein
VTNHDQKQQEINKEASYSAFINRILLLWWKDLIFSLREEMHFCISGKRQHEQDWGQQYWTMFAL